MFDPSPREFVEAVMPIPREEIQTMKTKHGYVDKPHLIYKFPRGFLSDTKEIECQKIGYSTNQYRHLIRCYNNKAMHFVPYEKFKKFSVLNVETRLSTPFFQWNWLQKFKSGNVRLHTADYSSKSVSQYRGSCNGPGFLYASKEQTATRSFEILICSQELDKTSHPFWLFGCANNLCIKSTSKGHTKSQKLLKQIYGQLRRPSKPY